MNNWTERSIAQALSELHFKYRHLVTVPNCHWSGHEADLLVVTKSLKLMDIEIKISKADFKADAKKDKWFNRVNTGELKPYCNTVKTTDSRGNKRVLKRSGFMIETVNLPRLHPQNIWKHYFVMPEEIWGDDLIEFLPSPASGVILICRPGKYPYLREVRKAKANRDFKPLTNEQIIDIARLASIRMWSAIKKEYR